MLVSRSDTDQALTHALTHQHSETYDVLVKVGVDPSHLLSKIADRCPAVRDKLFRFGADATNLFLRALQANDLDKIKTYVAQGADAARIMSICAREGFDEGLEMLVSAGVYPNTLYSGQPVLFYAAAGQQYSAVLKLLELGANPLVKNTEGETLLHKSAENGWVGLTKLFLSAGVALDDTDRHGKTALMSAVLAGQTTLVQLLLDKGADVRAVSSHPIERGTAIALAKRYHHPDIVALLQSHEANK
jgi:ankyrin repeat protein